MKVFFIQYKRLPRVGRLGFVVEFIVVGFKSFLFVVFLNFFPVGLELFCFEIYKLLFSNSSLRWMV